jgi:hypothetical protein
MPQFWYCFRREKGEGRGEKGEEIREEGREKGGRWIEDFLFEISFS